MDFRRILDEVSVVEEKLLGCDTILAKHQSSKIHNIDTCFQNKMDKAIALIMSESFTHYDWDTTKDLFLSALNSFLKDIDYTKKFVFVLHSEFSSSTAENSCYQKSSFFFTLVALLNVPWGRVAGMVCNRLYSFDVDFYDKEDLVYCVCEDSIYSGGQITRITESLVRNHNVLMEDIRVVCPISTRFERNGHQFQLYIFKGYR